MTQFMTTGLVLAQQGGPPWHDGDWDGGGWGPGFFVARFVIFVLVALLVWWLVRRSRRNAPVAAGRRVLAERFARGEIDAVEYRQRWTELASPAGRQPRKE